MALSFASSFVHHQSASRFPVVFPSLPGSNGRELISFSSSVRGLPSSLALERKGSSFAQTAAVRHLIGSLTRTEGHRFALVVARFNEVVTKLLLEGALETFKRYSVKEEDIDVVWVPGSFEIPVVATRLGKSGKYQAILCIGAVIRGDTTHYDAVANSAASGVLSASLNSGVPCIFGVLTCDDMDQAINRAGGKSGNKGAEAALVANHSGAAEADHNSSSASAPAGAGAGADADADAVSVPVDAATGVEIQPSRRLPDFLQSVNLKYVKLGYHYLITHLLTICLIPLMAVIVIEAAQMNPEDVRQLWLHLQYNLVSIIIYSAFLVSGTTVYIMTRPRSVYLVDYSCYRPPSHLQARFHEFMEHSRLAGVFDESSLEFQRKILDSE